MYGHIFGGLVDLFISYVKYLHKAIQKTRCSHVVLLYGSEKFSFSF
jgi:hypothetical protein